MSGARFFKYWMLFHRSTRLNFLRHALKRTCCLNFVFVVGLNISYQESCDSLHGMISNQRPFLEIVLHLVLNHIV